MSDTLAAPAYFLETRETAKTHAAGCETTGVHITIHGHFYQPPRENPYLNAIEPQPSAAPFANWNERILAECYRPNAFARVLDRQGRVVSIVNNYEYLSFNIGPTLMAWIERHDVEVYQRILAADRTSAARLNGHGNAIAQVYNHIILPLASDRDKYTQIRWGIDDFMTRFQRFPEGMWLAEAAIDYPTVTALINEGIKFVILAPSQAERIRPLNGEWQDVSDGSINPKRPYRCYAENGHLDIFFYDGPVSRDMGFNDVLDSSWNLGQRLGDCVEPEADYAQLVHCATDGETFGHHKPERERTLAYAFVHEFPARGWTVTNYAHFLSEQPPTWEVELKPITAWSCPHGVGRWERHCGCASEGGYQQHWRQPLRQALNTLRDQLVEIYEAKAPRYLRDPWGARDRYIEVILQRTPAVMARFLRREQARKLSATEQTDLWRLLEMQRHSQLMFTSCGWFFEEISRPETVQILSYAARSMELASELTGIDLETEFRDTLAEAPSNLAQYGHGAAVYDALVQPTVITPAQVAGHYAIASILAPVDRTVSLYNYTVTALDCDGQPQVGDWRQRFGTTTLAVGRVEIRSIITCECHDLVYAVLHTGGRDFHCCVKPFTSRRQFEHLRQRLLTLLPQVNHSEIAVILQSEFDKEYYTLRHLFARERQQLMRQLTQQTLDRLEQLYRQIYLDNYSVLMALRQENLPLPPELEAAATVTLNRRLLGSLRSLELDDVPHDTILELQAIANEAHHLGCRLELPEAAALMERLLQRYLWQLAFDFDSEALDETLWKLVRWLDVAAHLQLPFQLDRAQELFLHCLAHNIIPLSNLEAECALLSPECVTNLLRLSTFLRVNIDEWVVPCAKS